jgi:hypothetical protein
MAISVNWATSVIFIPKSDLTLIQSVPIEIRELNLNTFRLALKSLEDDEEGITYLKTHTHNTETSFGGLTLARVIQILDPYTVTFEDGEYAVNLVGANSNVADKLNLNQVSVRSANSAGLITVVQGSGVTSQDKTDIANLVWDITLSSHTVEGSMGQAINQLFDESGGKREIVGTQEIFYKADGVTEIMRFNLFDQAGNPSATNVYKRERV